MNIEIEVNDYEFVKELVQEYPILNTYTNCILNDDKIVNHEYLTLISKVKHIQKIEMIQQLRKKDESNCEEK